MNRAAAEIGKHFNKTGESLNAFGRRTGVSIGYLSSVMNGKKTMRLKFFNRLAKEIEFSEEARKEIERNGKYVRKRLSVSQAISAWR